jgi:uncharacterized coiled-coil DUF342 family protein
MNLQSRTLFEQLAAKGSDRLVRKIIGLLAEVEGLKEERKHHRKQITKRREKDLIEQCSNCRTLDGQVKSLQSQIQQLKQVRKFSTRATTNSVLKVLKRWYPDDFKFKV